VRNVGLGVFDPDEDPDEFDPEFDPDEDPDDEELIPYSSRLFK
jgi:hypothetical protein